MDCPICESSSVIVSIYRSIEICQCIDCGFEWEQPIEDSYTAKVRIKNKRSWEL